jgi:hypothetical protein
LVTFMSDNMPLTTERFKLPFGLRPLDLISGSTRPTLDHP